MAEALAIINKPHSAPPLLFLKIRHVMVDFKQEWNKLKHYTFLFHSYCGGNNPVMTGAKLKLIVHIVLC